MELLLSMAIVAGVLVAIWVWRAQFLSFNPQPDQRLPELEPLLQEDLDPSLAEHRQTFRRPHFLQTVVYVLGSTVILASFLIAFLSDGWSLLSLLLAVAELLLLFTHGTPLLISVTRTLTVSAEGIESRDLFGRRRIEWWEVQRFVVAEDLSRFRADGIRRRLTYDSAVFPPETKRALYGTLRAHLAIYQQELQPWPQALPLVRFVKANALGVGLFVAAMLLTALFGGRVLPEENVLGLRCAYASKYLREK